MKVVMNNVESLGSGIPRILRAYGEDCFKFTDNFIRITLPISVQDGTKSAPSRHQVGTKLMHRCTSEFKAYCLASAQVITLIYNWDKEAIWKFRTTKYK